MDTKCFYKDEDLLVNWARHDGKEFPAQSLHTHETAELLYFISGKATFFSEGTKHFLEWGDIVLTGPSETHYIEVEGNGAYERVVINFNVELFASLDPTNILLHALLERRAGILNVYKSRFFKDDIHKKHLENLFKKGTSEKLNAVSSLLLLLDEMSKIFIEKALIQDSYDSFEYKLIEYVNQNIGGSITAESVCQKFYISKPQLYRIFRRNTGMTMAQYVTLKRLMQARRLIAQGEKPTEVFSKCGYNDYSTFYRAYMKAYGQSPGKKSSDIYII